MTNRFYFKALDRTMRDVIQLSNSSCLNQPFGRKVMVFGGDFRQILLVIPRVGRQEFIHATINSFTYKIITTC